MTGKIVYVTVGTTKFDSLVSAITKTDALRALRDKGYNNVVVQIGSGEVIPSEENARQADINLSYYTYKNSIYDDILKADLVISHAGAGTCLEVLAVKKPLLVVINEELMHNHQKELAEQLSSEGYLFACTCATLTETIKKMDVNKLKEMAPPDCSPFENYLNKFMGLQQ